MAIHPYTAEQVETIADMRAAFRSGAARAWRKGTRTPQLEVAAKAECHWTTVSKAELGERVPRGDLALRFAPIYAELAVASEAS